MGCGGGARQYSPSRSLFVVKEAADYVFCECMIFLVRLFLLVIWKLKVKSIYHFFFVFVSCFASLRVFVFCILFCLSVCMYVCVLYFSFCGCFYSSP